MTDLLRAIAPLLALADIALVASFWVWRGRGKPLPARLEWLRTRNRLTRWLLTRQRLVLGGF